MKNDFDLDDITVSKVFLNLLSVSLETFIRSFQLKLLYNIVFTNKRLAKIGYDPHDTCTSCKEETSYLSLILRMSFYSSFFGKTLRNSGLYFQVKKEKFTLQDVYIGKLEKPCELLNYVMVLAKLHTWQSRKQDKIPECEVFFKTSRRQI